MGDRSHPKYLFLFLFEFHTLVYRHMLYFCFVHCGSFVCLFFFLLVSAVHPTVEVGKTNLITKAYAFTGLYLLRTRFVHLSSDQE